MTTIERLNDENRLRDVRADHGKAEGLRNRSRQRIKTIQEQAITERNAFMVLENAYEAIRIWIEAQMAEHGVRSDDHVATIT